MAYTNFATSKDFSAENIRKERLRRDGTLGGGIGQDKGIYYKDVALIRYKDDSVQVVNETGFMNTFLKRANDDFWNQISCI